MYHTPGERSEFYSMAELLKPPVLFTPTGDPDKTTADFGSELPSYYQAARATSPDHLVKLNGGSAGGGGSEGSEGPLSPHQLVSSTYT